MKPKKIKDLNIGIEEALYQYALLGLDMFKSGFKGKERYSYLIGKLLSYRLGFEDHNIIDPDIIEFFQRSKHNRKNISVYVLIEIDCLGKYHSQGKCECSIKVFSVISSIIFNYLDLLKDFCLIIMKLILKYLKN